MHEISASLRSAVLLAITLIGCSGSGPGEDAAAAVEPPMPVQRVLDQKFPADGQIHVRTEGEISIRADTPVCYRSDGFPVNAVALFRALGQPSSNESGSSRLEPAEHGRCQFRDDTVLIWGQSEPDRASESYKIRLTVWQGRSFWSGAISRTTSNLHPRSQRVFVDMEQLAKPIPVEVRLAASMDGDIADLSQKFTDYIRGHAL